MNNLLTAMNLAYNTTLKARSRYELAKNGAHASLPTPCDSVQQWHDIATTWLLQGNSRFWVSILCADYPPGLLELKDPPLILFGQGNRALLHARGVAMVGSRNATRTGLSTAQGFAKAFVQAGWAVVSGMAEGIDGAAHAGALDAQGATIAVLGCGPDQVYPKHHTRLKDQIVQQSGLILSEYPPGTAPQPAFFPRRNRIIAALADSLLVVEAALRSGSLITARVASELGRPVGAIPGSIHSSQSKGCHAMIKKGAMLIETAQELLDETMASLSENKTTPPTRVLQEGHNSEHSHLKTPMEQADELDENLDKVLNSLGQDLLHADHLAHQVGLSSEETLAALTELELMGHVLAESGNRWIRANGVS